MECKFSLWIELNISHNLKSKKISEPIYLSLIVIVNKNTIVNIGTAQIKIVMYVLEWKLMLDVMYLKYCRLLIGGVLLFFVVIDKKAFLWWYFYLNFNTVFSAH